MKTFPAFSCIFTSNRHRLSGRDDNQMLKTEQRKHNSRLDTGCRRSLKPTRITADSINCYCSFLFVVPCERLRGTARRSVWSVSTRVCALSTFVSNLPCAERQTSRSSLYSPIKAIRKDRGGKETPQSCTRPKMLQLLLPSSLPLLPFSHLVENLIETANWQTDWKKFSSKPVDPG